MNKIKVLIVDDSIKIIDFFSTIVTAEKDMQLVGVATSGYEAYEKAMYLQPDVILMDLQMEYDKAGIVATQRIKEKKPEIKIIILTIHDDDDLIFEAYTAGAMDFILKTDSIVSIVESIRKVFTNIMQMRPKTAEKLVEELTKLRTEKSSLRYMLNLLSKLTTAEVEVIKFLHRGYKYAQIAQKKSVEVTTIRSHANHILKKLGYKNMKETIKALEEIGVLDYFDSL